MNSNLRAGLPGIVSLAVVALMCLPRFLHAAPFEERKPNVILILADDLGYSELGCYGQTLIKTPNIDRCAQEGMRFVQCYSGSPVCAPSRCVLLTGLHTGHAFVRDNFEVQPEGQLPLPEDTITLPKLLQEMGYSTAIIGKWGLGFPGSSGDPLKQGFDHFFGYNCQRRAHNHYPTSLWRNNQKIVLEGNDGGPTGTQYAPGLMEQEAVEFISSHTDQPFFMLYATTIPHLALQVPDEMLDEYRGEWEDPPYSGQKGYMPQKVPRATYAGMVSYLDRSVGRMLDLLKALSMDKNTIIIIASDNGSTYDIGGYDPDFFKGTGPFRGAKGSLYEGGVRVPLIVRWPGKVGAGSINQHLCAFQDFLPTILDLAGENERTPAGLDGISFAAELLGTGVQEHHDYLYFEFPSYGGQQMVRMGDWVGVRQNLAKNQNAPVELYNVRTDVGERDDVAGMYPVMVTRLRDIMSSAHFPSKEFPFPALDQQ